ncbi:eCIS core domain-containing protein [Plantactinospora soyae]|uniref:eCIS core domain-containing protein n=1 Tax=Plantactinospora soyae TaxID=1544732 RepID=A0A927R902_9ACTN|nr:DUF4157 domain-containing protein [Plantactinospora soyae]MBE1489301.1 hypothetical protein [Plantactinospora soyae]
MRAHDPPDRDVPTRSTQPTRPGVGSAPPTGSVAAILALQRRAGNAAVTRAIQRLCSEHDTDQRQTHEHGDGQRSGPEPVQRSAVHEVLRAAGRPLDEPTRTDMEARLGADFSDVRLHTDALAQRSAAEVGARAYTSGSHVVIGQSGADRHTLAHELTHVIQQRSGPVADADDGHGLRISDPGDAFERAAEANAHRALSERPTQAHTAPVPAGPPSGTPAVQRVTEDDLHREPPGPSLRLRGPRRSLSGRRITQVEDQLNWRALSESHQQATGQRPDGKERISLDTDLTSLIELSPDETGRNLGFALSTVAEQEANIPRWVGSHRRGPAEMMEQLGRLDPVSRPYWQAQAARDQQLANDAVARAGRYQHESGAENAQALKEATAGRLRGIPMPAIDATDMLLLAGDGLVIGGSHDEEPFFAWATTHMAQLYKNGVRTLYLEVIREDGHQRLVDAYLSSGEMSPELTNFCNTYRRKKSVDLAAFLAAARGTGMRVKGTGGRPARLFGENLHSRAVMLNTYGEQVVRRDRAQSVGQGADPGKYLMQVGTAHASTHTNTEPNPAVAGGVPLPNQFPGINELLDVPAVRLEDSLNDNKMLRPI